MNIEFRQEKVKEFLVMPLVEIARESDVALETWSRWIHGKRSPTLDTIREVASRFGMSAVELVAAIELMRFISKAATSDSRTARSRKRESRVA